jgi:DNA-binding LytR/AlgR family response regulator
VNDADPWSRLRRDWLRDGWTQTLAIGAVVAVVMAAAGGFQTGAIPFLPRIGYWLVLVFGGVAMAQLIRRAVTRAPRFSRRRWLAAGIIACATTIPMTLVVAVSSALISGQRPRLERIWLVFPDVVVITLCTTVLAVLVHRETPAAQTSDAPAGAPPPKFLSRLTPKLAGAAIYAVEADDHYLRLHTSRGEDLILMRLSDAIAELEGVEGARTHRSWWVARAAVVSAERAEGRATLTLASGTQVPVSRSYAKPLREAGWF